MGDWWNPTDDEPGHGFNGGWGSGALAGAGTGLLLGGPIGAAVGAAAGGAYGAATGDFASHDKPKDAGGSVTTPDDPMNPAYPQYAPQNVPTGR